MDRELKQNSQVTRKIPPPSRASLSDSTGPTLDKESETRGSRCKHRDHIDIKYQHSSEESGEKSSLARHSFDADSSPKTQRSMSFASNSRYRWTGSDCERQENNACRCKENLEVVYPINHCFKTLVNYRTYHSSNTSAKYSRTVWKKFFEKAKRMTAKTKSFTFNHFDSVSIIRVLENCELPCGTSGVH